MIAQRSSLGVHKTPNGAALDTSESMCGPSMLAIPARLIRDPVEQ